MTPEQQEFFSKRAGIITCPKFEASPLERILTDIPIDIQKTIHIWTHVIPFIKDKDLFNQLIVKFKNAILFAKDNTIKVQNNILELEQLVPDWEERARKSKTS